MMTDEATLDGAPLKGCKGCGLLVPADEINRIICQGETLALLCSDCAVSAINTFSRLMSEMHATSRRFAQFGIISEGPIPDSTEEESP